MWSRNKKREPGQPAHHTADAAGGCSMQDTGLNSSSSAAPAAGENQGAASGTSTRRAEQCGAGISCTSSQPCLLVTALPKPPRHKPVFSAGVPAKPSLRSHSIWKENKNQVKGKMLLGFTCQSQAKRSSRAGCSHCQPTRVVL